MLVTFCLRLFTIKLETSGFLMFSGGIEVEHWLKVRQKHLNWRGNLD